MSEFVAVHSSSAGVATLVLARWERDLDREVLRRELDAGPAVGAAAAQ